MTFHILWYFSFISNFPYHIHSGTPVVYKDKEYFRDPVTFALVKDSVMVDCHGQASINYIGGKFRVQKENGYELLREEVQVMKPTMDSNTLFDTKLPHHLGMLACRVHM